MSKDITERKSQNGPVIWRMLTYPPTRRALLVGCSLQMFQQLSGINTVMYYSATILQMSGVRDDRLAIWLAGLTTLTNFLFTLLGVWLVERVGRRKLTLGSIIGTCLSLSLLAIGFLMSAQRSPPVTFHPLDPSMANSTCSKYHTSKTSSLLVWINISLHTGRTGRQRMQSPLHFTQSLTHVQLPNTYVRIVEDTICGLQFSLQHKLILKLHNLGLPSSLCHWIRDFLTNRPQVCGLILDNDETHYREEIQHLTQWCSNNLVLNTSKTKEVIVDYRRSRRTEHAPLLIHGEAVERVNNIKFLGIHITSDLTWSMNTAHLVKKGSTKTLLPQEAETCWTLPSAPDKLLQGHNREHPLPQCSSVVWQLHCTRPKILTHPGNGLFVSLPSGKWLCEPCMLDPGCGFCYRENGSALLTSSCVPVNKASTEQAAWGRCSNFSLMRDQTYWAYNYCPTSYSWLVLLGLVLYLAAFAPGMGPMPWTINSEIYPLWARSTGNACAAGVNWTFNILVSLTFLHLAQYFTYYGAFFLYSSLALLGFFFIYGCLPETKARRLEEIEALFENQLCSCGASDSDERRQVEYIRVKGSNYHLSDNDASDVD
ncbi:hypothetical protein L3Q82_009518 [Scortum barcoo]|uniref:Uncharacterized protein n=1 Tax=Scortum barcoo TaxID=214431 RepID=A0ACB8WG11_9TELE|nr:hypothetical protein L3Q82_009518 [Scortum barcoo]